LEHKSSKKKEKKANVIELDFTQMSGLVNEAVERLISEGKLVRDEETGEIIDPDDEEKIATVTEKNKKLKKYRLESKTDENQKDSQGTEVSIKKNPKDSLDIGESQKDSPNDEDTSSEKGKNDEKKDKDK